MHIDYRSRGGKGNRSSTEVSNGPSIPPPPELPANEKAPWINIPTSALIEDWAKLVGSENHSDVLFHLDSKSFHAHRLVLCSASDVFRKIFGIETKVKVPSLSSCLGWTKRRLQKITWGNINGGLVEGLTTIQKK